MDPTFGSIHQNPGVLSVIISFTLLLFQLLFKLIKPYSRDDVSESSFMSCKCFMGELCVTLHFIQRMSQ